MKLFLITIFLVITSSTFARYENINSYQDHKKNLKQQQVEGHTFAYIDEGEGPVIVLLHGIPTNSWMYRKMIGPLVSKGYRVIAPDLLGMGGSSRTKTPEDLTVKSQARYLHILLKEKLKLKSWTHVVHDFAGPITWEMAELEGFSIKKLIVLNTFAFKKGWYPGLNIFTKNLMKVATIKPLRGVFFSNAIKSMINDKNLYTKEELNQMVEGYVTPLKEGGSDTYKTLYFSANKLKSELPRYQRTLEKLSSVPSKIIWGGNDKFLSSTIQLEQIKQALNTKDNDILILKDSKHLITEEAPNEIVDFIE